MTTAKATLKIEHIYTVRDGMISYISYGDKISYTAK
jgi:hypothetical protein